MSALKYSETIEREIKIMNVSGGLKNKTQKKNAKIRVLLAALELVRISEKAKSAVGIKNTIKTNAISSPPEDGRHNKTISRKRIQTTNICLV